MYITKFGAGGIKFLDRKYDHLRSTHPAIIYSDETREFRSDSDRRHRFDGPAYDSRISNYKAWFLEGEFIRDFNINKQDNE